MGLQEGTGWGPRLNEKTESWALASISLCFPTTDAN